MALLEVKNLTKNFGGLTAVGDVSMELNEGELVGLIGPNGAGKTTLFNLLTGVYEPSEGTITLDGTVLNGKAPYKIASLGLSRTFQNIRLFKDMTVLENVLVGLSNKQPSNFFASLLRLPKYYSSEEELKAKAMELLAIFNLDGEADTLAKNLAYGLISWHIYCGERIYGSGYFNTGKYFLYDSIYLFIRNFNTFYRNRR